MATINPPVVAVPVPAPQVLTANVALAPFAAPAQPAQLAQPTRYPCTLCRLRLPQGSGHPPQEDPPSVWTHSYSRRSQHDDAWRDERGKARDPHLAPTSRGITCSSLVLFLFPLRTMPPSSRFSYLKPFDSPVADFVAPALLILLPLLGLRYVYSLIKSIRAPSWYPGSPNLVEAGTRVDISATSASTLAPDKSYDVVIVGGGACGAVLAARLSEDPSVSVLLLEAGHADTLQLFSRIPSGFARLFGTLVDWNIWTEGGESAAGVKGRRLRWPRGRMLGGCTAINAMICHHSSPSDFDEWETLGNPGWNYASLLPYFKKSQSLVPSEAWPNAKIVDPKHRRGRTGPLKVGYSFISALSSAFITASGALGIKIRDDLNTDYEGSGTLGISRAQTFISEGSRVSTSTAYLTPEVCARPNLNVATGATVTRILFSEASNESKPRAIGVEFTSVVAPYPDDPTALRRVYRAKARTEVILSAGSLATPQILKVSGVGPKEELESAGVPVVVDLPDVGEHLMDHITVGLIHRAKQGTSLQYLDSPVQGLPALVEWLRYRTGPLTSNVAEVISFVRSTDVDLAKQSGVPAAPVPDHSSGGVGPDIEFLQSPMGFLEHGTVAPPRGQDFYTIAAILLRPQSTGSVRIRSPSTLVRPVIDARILSHEDDVKALVWSLKMCHKITKTEPLASMLEGPYNGPGFPRFPDFANDTDAELGEWVRAQTQTIYHPIGTVRMGPSDKGGCVDTKLRVYGIDGLRVCDASIFPQQLSGHPMAPLVAIAERFADELKDEL